MLRLQNVIYVLRTFIIHFNLTAIMKNLALCLAFLLLLSTGAYAESLYDYETLDIELIENGQVLIEPKYASYYVDYLRAYLYLYPKNNNNNNYEIQQTTATPSAKE